jgi:putative endonuclease
LVYFEATSDICGAISREKQIKAWRREKKDALIESVNRDWRDLSAEWFEDKEHSPDSRRDSSLRSE